MLPDELYETVREYYKSHSEELKLKHGVRSLTGFCGYVIREWLKSKQII